ncbi:MAG: nucleotidyltransferase domain-containing protein [Nanoarchaeota archaeon]|nr:nucleotidyltransferase domain-containing protein [Nanoarchaeota archaeon]MBU1005065.1 nucleotidyltransferase domain-containing protein [Nanoarchaeota archaeon]MBU1946273.1 nucleotidyltransferase domain-containing protein [Nanoarchaeota archaeon]
MIEEIITSNTRRKLLTLFLTNPKTRFYIRELEKKTGDYVNSIRKELTNLESIGLIIEEKVANLKYYSVNEKCIIYPELKSMILKTSPSEALIKEAAESIKQKLKGLCSIILFGSLAKNNLNFNDIDLLIISKNLNKEWRKRDAIILEIEKIGLSHGITLHIELISKEEFEFSVSQGAPLLLELSLANKMIYDDGFFKNQMAIFKENMLKWKAKKVNNVWEVPELAVKV